MKDIEVLFKSQTQLPVPYRTYSINMNGIRLGGTPINNRFPWRNAQRVVRSILQAWARDIINRYDAAEVSAILSQWANKWVANYDVTEIQTDNTVEHPSPKYCLSFLLNNSIKRKEYFKREHGSTDGPIMSSLSEEMIKAISHSLSKIGVKPRIQWEVESLPSDFGVYHILLEGGKYRES